MKLVETRRAISPSFSTIANSLQMIFTSFDSCQIGNSDAGIIERKPLGLDWSLSDGTSVHIN